MNYTSIIFALLSALTAALVAVFGKIGLESIDANTATAVRSIIMALFLVTFITIQGKFSQISIILANRKALSFIALSGIAGATSWLFYFIAMKNGKASLVAPIDKLSVIITIVFSILFLSEKVSLISGLGVIFMAGGILLVVLGQ